jgi:nucleotidyltransferase/DNA polymerase involved in DNA repair
MKPPLDQTGAGQNNGGGDIIKSAVSRQLADHTSDSTQQKGPTSFGSAFPQLIDAVAICARMETSGGGGGGGGQYTLETSRHGHPERYQQVPRHKTRPAAFTAYKPHPAQHNHGNFSSYSGPRSTHNTHTPGALGPGATNNSTPAAIAAAFPIAKTAAVTATAAAAAPSATRTGIVSVNDASSIGGRAILNDVEGFFRNSRLHHIGSWRESFDKVKEAHMQQQQQRDRERGGEGSGEILRSGGSDSSGGRQPLTHPALAARMNQTSSDEARLVMHVDMDCFFVSVLVKDRPDLKGRAVAVAHGQSSSANSSEISSCNYKAREHGLRAGMFMKGAREKCPDLVVLPYDFAKYQDASEKMYKVLLDFSLNGMVQPISCDEAYLQLPPGLATEERGMSFATSIRQSILQATGCPCSAGVSGNMLLAKMATNVAKPNGQKWVDPTPTSALAFMATVDVKELPGVGWKMRGVLQQHGVKGSCATLHKIPCKMLQSWFGTKKGETIFAFSRGQDTRPLKLLEAKKSVGAEMNYAIRFKDNSDVHSFMTALCEEVATRLCAAGMVAKTLTLKIKQRASDAEEPAKFMGHGKCVNHSKGHSLSKPTDDPVMMRECALVLLRNLSDELRMPPDQIRGVGLQMTRLVDKTTATANAGIGGTASPDKMMAKFLRNASAQVEHSSSAGGTGNTHGHANITITTASTTATTQRRPRGNKIKQQRSLTAFVVNSGGSGGGRNTSSARGINSSSSRSSSRQGLESLGSRSSYNSSQYNVAVAAPASEQNQLREEFQPDDLRLSQMDASVVDALPPELRVELQRASASSVTQSRSQDSVAGGSRGGNKEDIFQGQMDNHHDGLHNTGALDHEDTMPRMTRGESSGVQDTPELVATTGIVPALAPAHEDNDDAMMPITMSQIDRVVLPEDIRQALIFLTEIVLSVLILLFEIVLIILFLTGILLISLILLAVLICFTEIALTVLIFLTDFFLATLKEQLQLILQQCRRDTVVIDGTQDSPEAGGGGHSSDDNEGTHDPERVNIATLVSFGFKEVDAKEALQACEGSPDRAADRLFRKAAGNGAWTGDGARAGPGAGTLRSVSSSSRLLAGSGQHRQGLVIADDARGPLVEGIGEMGPASRSNAASCNWNGGAACVPATTTPNTGKLSSWKEFMRHIRRFDGTAPIDSRARQFLLGWMKTIVRPKLGDLQCLMDVATHFIDSGQLDQLVVFLRFVLRHARSPMLNAAQIEKSTRKSASGKGRWESSGTTLLEYVQDAVQAKHGFVLQATQPPNKSNARA